jgi:formylglycine-generating enzyme required for sulfatase activity|tara:strand:+ start:9406 stop:11163 length:1758 start_codon:yes stop_codon:yes gene_type:complete
MKRPFTAYQGDDPYIFVSYAHEDSASVYPEIQWLHDQGFNVWYDEGISPGHSWPQELADKVADCSLFLLFVTANSPDSEFCVRETNFAVNRKREVLTIHLAEGVALPTALEFIIGDRQAIIRSELEADAYQRKVLDSIERHVPRSAQVLEIDVPEARLAESLPAAATLSINWFYAFCAIAILLVGMIHFTDISVASKAITGVLGAALCALAFVALRYYNNNQRIDWAHRVLLPEIKRCVDHDENAAALELIRTAESLIGDDNSVAQMKTACSSAFTFKTNPDGVQVFLKPYDQPHDDWAFVGATPLIDSDLARGVFRLKLEKPGYRTVLMAVRNPSLVMGNVTNARLRGLAPVIIQMDQDAVLEAEMVRVPGGEYGLTFPGFNVAMTLDVPAFRIDRYPVSNREYKEFVDADAYADTSLWPEIESEEEGQPLEEVIKSFVDTTGRPGPANWELGMYPQGADDYPVTGISWFEAVAYSKFRGKSLPTFYNWIRAAFPLDELSSHLSPGITSFSNYSATELVANGSTEGLGPYGTYDMAGNVREWVWNATGQHRWIMGVHGRTLHTCSICETTSPHGTGRNTMDSGA